MKGNILLWSSRDHAAQETRNSQA